MVEDEIYDSMSFGYILTFLAISKQGNIHNKIPFLL